MNVFEFALQMELDGKGYYETLAGETASSGLKAIFTSLAADEQKHYDTILALQAGSIGEMADSKVLDDAKSLFRTLTADRTIAASLSKSLDGYRHAMENEANSIQLYETMAKKEPDAGIVKLLLRIAAEEKKHYNIMDNLYDFTLAPQNYLEWAEFSNLKTL
jgi:rubrerythrin